MAKVTTEVKRKVMKLAAQYRRMGYSRSEALRRAWREVKGEL